VARVIARARVLLVVLVVGAVAGCGGGGGGTATAPGTTTTATTAERHADAQPALCGRLRATVAGRADDPAATELSGLVVSASQPGVLWAHNDSGDRARIFALRASDGHVLASLDVPGAQAVDWEDIAVGPGGDLLLGDIGDNDAKRDDVVVYRIPEPRLSTHPTATAPAQAITLTYPDGAHNAETLIADRRTGELVIVTKTLSGRSAIYSANLSSGARQTLKLRGHVNFGLAGLTTAGDVSADGHIIAIRTYSDLSVWHRRAGTSIAATLSDGTRCTTTLAAEGQGESLALTAQGTSFYTIPEGPSPPLRHYSSTLHP
jgi:hypothetical protein